MKINSNMRCIEINIHILTMLLLYWINSNMRCIEIVQILLLYHRHLRINSNMRCIEIKVCFQHSYLQL